MGIEGEPQIDSSGYSTAKISQRETTIARLVSQVITASNRQEWATVQQRANDIILLEHDGHEDVTAHKWLGHVFFLKGDYDKALQHLLIAARQGNYPDAQIMYFVALIYEKQERWHDALGALHEALKQNDHNTKIKIQIGKLLIRLHQYKEAEQLFEQILQRHSDNVEVWKGKGVALFHQQQYDDAIAILDIARKIDPSDHEIVEFLLYAHEVLARKFEKQRDDRLTRANEHKHVSDEHFTLAEKHQQQAIIHRDAAQQEQNHAHICEQSGEEHRKIIAALLDLSQDT